MCGAAHACFPLHARHARGAAGARREFIEKNVTWAHLDIAGPVWARARATHALLASAEDAAPTIRRRVGELAIIRPTGALADTLCTLLHDADTTVAETAAAALGECPLPRASRATVVDALVTAATTHDEPLVREAAVAALGSIGDPRGLPAILAGCTDKPAIRRRAVLALAPFDGPEVDAAIDRALEDRDWQTRQAAELLRER